MRTDKPAPIPGAEMVAICDTFEDRRRQAGEHLEALGQGHVSSYADHREMLDKEDLDAVIIATPDHTHTPIAIDAARAGCDAYVEKCLSHSVEEAIELGRVLESTGRLVQVGYQLRQDRLRHAAREIIARGELGQVTMVQDFISRNTPVGAWKRPVEWPLPGEDQVDWPLFLGPAPWREYDASRYFEWRKYWDYGTGICGDLLSHSLDSAGMVLGLGMPGAASAAGGIYHWKDGREVPDALSTVLEYPDRDLLVSFQSTLASSYTGNATRILGTRGSMELSYEIKLFPDANSPDHVEEIVEKRKSPREPYIHIKPSKEGLDVLTAPSELWLEGRGMTTTVRDGEMHDTTKLHHEEFLACVRTREQPSAGYASALPSTIGANLAAEAYREGRRVELDDTAMRSR